MTLARALKYLKRVQQRLREAANHMEESNSFVKGNEREYNSREQLQEYDKLMDHLITVKTAIQRANEPIFADILRLSELKGKVETIRKLPTDHGRQDSRYRLRDEPAIEYVATIREKEKTEMIRQLEAEIDAIQEKLDAFNNRTEVEVETLV